MPKRDSDRRTQRTLQALRSAFVGLVLTRGYESITIGDIVRAADVGRSTFYLHFPSKEALLRESLKVPSSSLAACVDQTAAPRLLMPLLEHFREQRAVNRVFFVDPIRSIWVKSLAATIEPRLVRAVRSGGLQLVLPSPLSSLVLAEMQIALITHWLIGRSSLKPELVASALIANTNALVRGNPSIGANHPGEVRDAPAWE
jgi:AcrR family transcriptional regulator